MAETAPQAFYAVESWSSWIWRKLGFGECRAPRNDADEFAEGFAPSWFIAETRVYRSGATSAVSVMRPATTDRMVD